MIENSLQLVIRIIDCLFPGVAILKCGFAVIQMDNAATLLGLLESGGGNAVAQQIHRTVGADDLVLTGLLCGINCHMVLHYLLNGRLVFHPAVHLVRQRLPLR